MENYVLRLADGVYLRWATTTHMVEATRFEEEVAQDFADVFRKHPPVSLGDPILVEVITI